MIKTNAIVITLEESKHHQGPCRNWMQVISIIFLRQKHIVTYIPHKNASLKASHKVPIHCICTGGGRGRMGNPHPLSAIEISLKGPCYRPLFQLGYGQEVRDDCCDERWPRSLNSKHIQKSFRIRKSVQLLCCFCDKPVDEKQGSRA